MSLVWFFSLSFLSELKLTNDVHMRDQVFVYFWPDSQTKAFIQYSSEKFEEFLAKL